MTTSIVFDHRGRTKKGADGPVEVRVTISRKVYYIGTGVRVRKEEFRLGMVVNRADAPELNERLEILHRRIEKEINRCLSDGVEIDVAEIRRRVAMLKEKTDDHEIETWIESQLPLLNVSEGTRQHYSTLLMRMAEFGGFGSWRNVDVDLIIRWNAWLRELTVPLTANQIKAGVKPKKIGDAAVYSYHKNLKAMLHRAMSCGLIDKVPYDCLRGKFSRGEKENVEYLTDDEMRTIQELDLVPGSELATCRDVFVFQMFTGMGYADAMAFDKSNYKCINGKWVARSERIKTGVPFVNVLLPPVVEVLERYGWELPRFTNEHYNRVLKEIGKLACIETSLHSHLARHTFATFMLRNGVRIENLSKMLGHTKITMTQRYAKVLAESVRDEFDMIAEKLKTP